jgi:hypothetical protein
VGVAAGRFETRSTVLAKSREDRMTDHEDREYEQRVSTFENLAQAINAVFEQYGKHDSLEPGDYSFYEKYWGFRQVKVVDRQSKNA